MENKPQKKRWLITAGVVTVALAIVAPFYQRVILPAAFDLGTGVFWISTSTVALLLGLICVIFGIKSHGTPGVQLLLALTTGAATLGLLFVIADSSWKAYVGPTATIIIPDDFTGRFTITLDEYVEPSAATAGMSFVYRVPRDGHLQHSRGWLNLRFRFDSGENVPGGPYYVEMRRDNGRRLRYEEFKCGWLEKHPGRGIWCEVSLPGANAKGANS